MGNTNSKLQRFIGPGVLIFYIIAISYVYVMDKTYGTFDIEATVEKERLKLVPNQEIIRFMSKNPFGLYDILNEYDSISEQEVYGVLTMPDSYDGKPVPLIIAHAGSGNWSDHHQAYIQRYNDSGFATLKIHSFDSRGVSSTVGEQISCTTAMMILDSYKALEKISSDRRIDSDRVGITGWSLGGGVALFTAWEPVKNFLSPDKGFAAHLPIYPPCIIKPETIDFTDAPIQILIGELDDWVSAEACSDIIEDINNDGSANAEIIIYPDSHHSFDSSRELTFNENAYSVDDCELIVTDSGAIYTKNEGFPMTTPILQRIGLFLCAERGTHWGYSDPKMGAKSIDDASSFMINHLINN